MTGSLSDRLDAMVAKALQSARLLGEADAAARDLQPLLRTLLTPLQRAFNRVRKRRRKACPRRLTIAGFIGPAVRRRSTRTPNCDPSSRTG